MTLTTHTRSQLFWRLQIGGWLMVMPVFTSVTLVVYPDLAIALTVGVTRQLIGFVLSLGLWAVYQRWSAATFRFAPYVWKIALCCGLATTADLALSELARHAFAIPEPPVLAARGVIFVRLALYVAWSALYFAIRQEIESRETDLRLAQAEAANREAELYLLRAQINPHFLLNALNGIIGKAEYDPAGVVEATHAVADYLRYSLTHTAHRAPLGEELDAMANYLAIEQSQRGPHRLRWSIDATAGARAALAPSALIQPLIENAIKYGLDPGGVVLQLRLTARTEATELVVAVENSGAWITRQPGEEDRRSTGIGLTNLRRRLVLLCGEAARLDVSTPPGFVRIEVRMPLASPASPASPA